MDLEQSLWSCSGLIQSQRLWEALSGSLMDLGDGDDDLEWFG